MKYLEYNGSSFSICLEDKFRAVVVVIPKLFSFVQGRIHTSSFQIVLKVRAHFLLKKKTKKNFVKFAFFKKTVHYFIKMLNCGTL